MKPTAHALAAAWEQELASIIASLPDDDARFALAHDLVVHRLEDTVRAYPECAAYAAAIIALVGQHLRYDAHAEALAALPIVPPSTPAGAYCLGLAHRPSSFLFYYDLYWTGADLALEAGSPIDGDPYAPGSTPDPERVAAEIAWQRERAARYR